MKAAFSKYINSSETLKALDARFPDLLVDSFAADVTALAAEWGEIPFLRFKLSPKAEECLWHRGLMWKSGCLEEAHTPESGVKELKTWATAGKKPWRLPTELELIDFVKDNNCPWYTTIFSKWFVITSTRVLGLSTNLAVVSSSDNSKKGHLLALTDSFQGDMDALVCHAYLNNWSVFMVGDAANTDLLKPLKVGTSANVSPLYRDIDTYSANLPPLEAGDFTDQNKGLWEFWGLDPAGLEALGLRARNPADDVQQGMVAIDFGTSSTVVAVEQNGVGQLLRIGVTDFWETPKPSHYENPTVLELVDLEALLEPWRTEAYRPGVAWEDVCCSHDALVHLRDAETDPKVVASILTKIKQWALREGDGTRVRLTDREGIEHELVPLTLRQPVKGRPLEVSEADPFDPVELYAWFLGLTINWRRRGIFLRYYMSFPVGYPREVKDKILASFRRGLQRSLPSTLVTLPVFEQFTVEERASEPAAYAAIALPTLGILPTPEGVAYAVFDFGGGTADFDFGYYRLATDTEEGAGVEQVLEHFGNGGDKFLGGENLLEHLAYLTFRHNIEICRKQKIAFTKPLEALDFTGSEMFLERTQAAATNALMLVSRLRTFWETGTESYSTGIAKIDLIDREGKKVPCEFTVPYAELKAFLQDRLEQGVHNFFTALKKAFGDELPAEVQVLLAGNASRSTIVLGLFGLLPDDHELAALVERTTGFWGTLFPQQCPAFTIHEPLAVDESNVNRPTCKTGVALGLLELCPGSATRVVNHAVQNDTGDAPFQHYVGRIRQKKFHVSLHQGGAYQQWVELGPVSEDRVFKLFHSQAARALSGSMALGDPALILVTLEFAGDTTGQQVFARPVKPHEIEICTAASLDAAARGLTANSQALKFV